MAYMSKIEAMNSLHPLQSGIIGDGKGYFKRPGHRYSITNGNAVHIPPPSHPMVIKGYRGGNLGGLGLGDTTDATKPGNPWYQAIFIQKNTEKETGTQVTTTNNGGTTTNPGGIVDKLNSYVPSQVTDVVNKVDFSIWGHQFQGWAGIGAILGGVVVLKMLMRK